MKKLFSYLLAGLMLSAITLSSCEKDKDPDAPELPPAESLIIDFASFGSPDDTVTAHKSASDIEIPGIRYYNWRFSLLNIAYWNTYITVALGIPVASYLEAFNHDPEYLGENKWQWKYSYTFNGIEYSAKLIAYRLSNEEFKAEMYISKSNIFSDFKWYEGTIRYDRTNASWTMYDSPLNNTALLSIEWNRDWDAGSGDITYSVIKPGISENGSYISFEIDPLAEYDASYEMQVSQKTTTIEWNRTNHSGHVSSFTQFGDELWHCWNELLQDTECQ